MTDRCQVGDWLSNDLVKKLQAKEVCVHQTEIKIYIIDSIISLGHKPDIFKIVSVHKGFVLTIHPSCLSFVHTKQFYHRWNRFHVVCLNILNPYLRLSTQYNFIWQHLILRDSLNIRLRAPTLVVSLHYARQVTNWQWYITPAVTRPRRANCVATSFPWLHSLT
jgi:predicted histidine transporter YuiF (NhaC family)